MMLVVHNQHGWHPCGAAARVGQRLLGVRWAPYKGRLHARYQVVRARRVAAAMPTVVRPAAAAAAEVETAAAVLQGISQCCSTTGMG